MVENSIRARASASGIVLPWAIATPPTTNRGAARAGDGRRVRFSAA